ncbi:uncharacterized protein HaLaN_26317 [Haematococcus lacustris]|uniref:Thiol methyltransferase 2 n=1 Tax=Haematococcus lacustris TaxID=44745 RepID=A0A6A0A5Y3_HAELA|nr:uncharacterized protein HaLaN_26317 [Haematococcus lacustris]
MLLLGSLSSPRDPPVLHVAVLLLDDGAHHFPVRDGQSVACPHALPAGLPQRHASASHAGLAPGTAPPSGLKPGQAFDKSGSSPRLVQLLSNGVAKGQRCVVPGCGRGYDLAALVTAGASHAVGVEISNTAAAAARAYIAHDSALTSEQQERITVQEADYLQDGAGTDYDLGVDYTFFCALHPSLRPSWAAAWAKALRPGGLLITLIFPVDPAADPNHGPPFPGKAPAV